MAEVTDTPWKINPDARPPGTYCVCGHVFGAHGTGGRICCLCDCNVFRTKSQEFDPAKPKAIKSIP